MTAFLIVDVQYEFIDCTFSSIQLVTDITRCDIGESVTSISIIVRVVLVVVVVVIVILVILILIVISASSEHNASSL